MLLTEGGKADVAGAEVLLLVTLFCWEGSPVVDVVAMGLTGLVALVLAVVCTDVVLVAAVA